MFRRVLFCVLHVILALPIVTLAQPKLEPVPEAPPASSNAPGEPQITITPGPNDRIEEFIVDGQRGLKVTRPDGNVYYLVPDQRDAGIRDPSDSGVRPPLWVIKRF